MGALVKLFLIAGEASGDKLGGALMEGLNSLRPGISYDGIGGRDMEAQGLTSRFPMERLSVMGIAEVLPRYFELKRRIRDCADWVIETGADALITIDSPDFCLRVAKLVKAARPDLPVIHYVAPSVWAWRPGRAAKMAAHVDHVLALLPFEPPYMEAAGMTCDFVGHPVVARPEPTPDTTAGLRASWGEGPFICVLPGSRRSEVARMGPVFREVLEQFPYATPIWPAAPGRDDEVRALADGGIVVPSDDPVDRLAVYGACDVALAASGTVSLELAAAGTPMVIAYDVAWLTRQIMTRMALIDTVTLVNLVTETRAVPEFIGDKCRADLIAPALAEVLQNPGDQVSAMADTMDALGKGGPAPGLRAAQSVLDAIARR